MRFCKEFDQGIGDFGADPRRFDRGGERLATADDEFQVGLAQCGDKLGAHCQHALDHLGKRCHAHIASRQVTCGNLADMADAEREQEAVEPDLATQVDRGEQFVDDQFRHAVAGDQRLAMFVQAEDVGGGGDQAVAEKLLDPHQPQPANVKGVA
ncbi:hypothetical protein D9M73_126840 [compost metagenome]